MEGWVWDPHEAGWLEGFDCLGRFVKREKHARVPDRHIEDGFKLGIWASTQRMSYKKISLTPDRVQALEAVKGWLWDTREAK